jgi:hypothetical protein
MSAAPNLFHEDAEGWIRWRGGRCPVHPETIVDAWLKGIGKSKYQYEAQKLEWGARIEDGARLPGSILGYRIVEAKQ